MRYKKILRMYKAPKLEPKRRIKVEQEYSNSITESQKLNINKYINYCSWNLLPLINIV